MGPSSRKHGLLALFSSLMALGGSGCAQAGWMSFLNDTKDTIVIQETLTVNGQSRLGKPQRLFSGEAMRDAQCNGGVRVMSIFDPARPNRPIFSGNFPCPAANENILYQIKSDGKGGLSIDTVKTPVPSPLTHKK